MSAVRLLLSLLFVCYLPPSTAHEGHDHGAPPPPTPERPLEPRLYASSGDFELVALLDGARLRIFLDDFATNRPIDDAVIELEGGALKATASHQGGGLYALDASDLAKPGRHDLVFTITTPTNADLLLGTLEVLAAVAATDEGPGTAPQWYDSPRLLQGALGFLALWVLLLLARRDRRQAGVAVTALTLVLTLPVPSPAFAHGGEDHSHGEPAAPAAAGSGPTRQADGSLFVPKPAQHLWGLRTARAEAGEWPDAFALSGHVIADPAASGFVQAPLHGRIELVEGGVANLGSVVQAGEVLAWLEPILDAVDHTTLQADLAELDGQLTIVRRNLERFRQLGANASRQEVDDAEAELASLTRRREAIAASFHERRPLTAPVAGVLALRNASPGQIVDAGETLFTIVDPQRLWVEALLYDTEHATHLVAATALTAAGEALRLTPQGGAYELRGHALPLQFRIEPPLPRLAVGQPLEVHAQAWHARKGVRIPSEALQKGTDGGGLVWVHQGAEQFRPQRVEARPLDGSFHVVTAGLAAGERVVTRGASLLGQIR